MLKSDISNNIKHPRSNIIRFVMYLLGGFILRIESTLSFMSYAATITMKLTPVRKALENLQSRGVCSGKS